MWNDLLPSVLDSSRFMAAIVDYLPILVMAVILGFISLAAYHKNQQEKKRQLAIQATADQLGLAYQQTRPVEFDGRIVKYKVLQQGSNRQSSNFIVAQTDQASLVLFDHRYTVGSGKNKSTHRQTVAWMTGQQLQAPHFILSPESWVDRLVDKISKKDIDFVEDPEFSKLHVLHGDDAEAIRKFFTSKRRAALNQLSRPTVECFPGEFILYRPGLQVSADKLKELMNEAFQLYQAFATDALDLSDASQLDA